jgi:DNA helicase-2/ATP-dependent DNA helicase PcrA
MKLTDEQRLAIECEKSTFLTACPGSGKTRVITAKLGRCLEEVDSTPRGVACITYTNAAVHEIETRARRSLGVRKAWALDISTIHSFCLNNIFRQHAHRLPYFQQGFKIIGQDSEEFETLVERTRAAFGKTPSGRDADDFGQLRYDQDGVPVGPSIASGSISAEEARHFWHLMHGRRQLDFASLLFYSLALCLAHPEICDHLSARFSWILVDEFQDTTDLQVAIFKEIYRRGNTRFFLVGDLCQSIFGFAGAAPALAESFAVHIGAQRGLTLSANFRSSPAIIADGELIFPRTPPMRAEGSNKGLALSTHFVIAASPTHAVTDHFLPRILDLGITYGESAVLANSWFKLIPIAKELRARGVPVLGPGARPYRRQRIFATVAERICGHLCEPDFEALVGVERALFDMILEVTNRPPQGLFTYEGRRLVYQILTDAANARDHSTGGLDFLYSLAARVSERLHEENYLRMREAELLRESVIEMERDVRKNKIDPADLSIDDMGILARPKRAVKLLTFHASKGREFGAVAMVDLNEGSIPFYLAKTMEELDEAQRLFYVGLTRAEKYLLYAPDNRDYRNRPSRFIGANFVGKF